MDGDDAVNAKCEFGGDVVAPGAQVTDVGIDGEPRRGDKFVPLFPAADAIHEGGVHDFHRKHDAVAGGERGRPLHSFAEAFDGAVVLRFVIDVVARELDGADAAVHREPDGFFHDAAGFVADGRVVAAEGVAAVAGEAHRGHGDAGVKAGADEVEAFGLAPVEAGEAGVGFVDGDFNEVVAAGFGERQPLCPA